MRTSAAIISSFAALAASAPLHARTFPVMGAPGAHHIEFPSAPAVGVPVVPHVGMPAMPGFSAPSAPGAGPSSGGYESSGYAKRQGVDAGLDLEDVTDDLDLDDVVDDLDLLKRDISLPVVSLH
jgi:hypothetical protein